MIMPVGRKADNKKCNENSSYRCEAGVIKSPVVTMTPRLYVRSFGARHCATRLVDL